MVPRGVSRHPPAAGAFVAVTSVQFCVRNITEESGGESLFCPPRGFQKDKAQGNDTW